jgi:hypothetical protein
LSRVICPFCCKLHDFSVNLQCPTFSSQLPRAYIHDYSRVPPLWLMTVGFPRHGKTTYLAALTWLLEKLPSVLEGMHYRTLDTDTYKRIQEMRQQVETGELPQSTAPPSTTEKQMLRPLLFQAHDMPGLGSRCLVLYDVAGESFASPERVGENAPALRQVKTVWFLVSLTDLERRLERRIESRTEGWTITDLFNVYLSGIDDLKIDPRGWNLIVVYTKSDETPFPPEIKDTYLLSDPITEIARSGEQVPLDFTLSLPDYLDGMRGVSEELEEFTRRRVNGGAGFINMVRARGMNLVFSVTSALGQSLEGNTRYLNHGALPYRVLDPFLWALTLERPGPTRTLRLLLDASPGCEAAYKNLPVAELWERLNDHGEVFTYFLGQTRPVSMPGQPPPRSAPARSRQRLIGPLLQGCTAADCVVMITTQPVLDFDDFAVSEWRDRLVLVAPGGEPPFEWDRTFTFRPGDDVEFLVDGILRF